MPPTFSPRERWNDSEEASRSAHESHESQMWTALPGIVEAHDTEKNTIKVNSAVKLKHVKQDGTSEWIQMPTFEDVPILYTGGGGASITPPMKKGDEVLLVFASRSVENWHQQGGVQNQTSARMHDLSDGFAIPGFRSQPRKLSNVNADKWQLRTDDGQTYVEFDPTSKEIKTHSEQKVTHEVGGNKVVIDSSGIHLN